MIKKFVLFIKSNTTIKGKLKSFSIKHPILTKGLLRIYRKNIPIIEIVENRERVSDEELQYLSSEAQQIYERITE